MILENFDTERCSTLSTDQANIVDSELLISPFNVVLSLPTGAGKTYLAKYGIWHALKRGFRVIYLTPLRALANELYEEWTKEFAPYKVGVFTSDWAGNYPIPFKSADLMIMTPERLDFCLRNLRSHWDWLPQVDVVIWDEFHLTGEAYRGGRIEASMVRLMRVNPFVRVHALTATIGNLQEVSDWLGAVSYKSNDRPIPLTWSIHRFKRATDKPEVLLSALKTQKAKGGKTIVFVGSRKKAEELTQLIQEEHNDRVAFHHAGLDSEDRSLVEREFRDGLLDVVICTSTLELGINMPASCVILYDLWLSDALLSTNSVWQRGGRAGRRGFDSKGEVILMAWSRDSVNHYQVGRFEPIRSQLDHDAAIAEQIIVEIACGYGKTMKQLGHFFDMTLAAKQKRLPKLSGIIAEMTEAEMIEVQKDGSFKATNLGRVSVRHMLPPSTVLMFRRALERFNELSFYDLLLICTSSPDCQPTIRVDYEELEAIAQALSSEPSALLEMDREEVQNLLGIDGKQLLSALKMSWLLRSWTRLGNIAQVANLGRQCYPFDLKRLIESAQRLTAALNDVHLALNETKSEHISLDFVTVEEKLKVLERMLSGGFDEQAATLSLVEGIGPTFSQHLLSHHIKDIEDLAQAEPAYVKNIDISTKNRKGTVGEKRAEQWIKAACDMVDSSRSAFRYREEKPDTLRIMRSNLPENVEVYRLRRARELHHFAEFKIVDQDQEFIVDPYNDSCRSPNCIAVHSAWYERRAQGENVSRPSCNHILAAQKAIGISVVLPPEPEKVAEIEQLKITPVFLIRGGRDEHVVEVIDDKPVCDCPDKKGYDCKHNLYVRGLLNDTQVLNAIAMIEDTDSDRLDLLKLWLTEWRSSKDPSI